MEEITPTIESQIPFIKKTTGAPQLIVDGRPFLMLGGELQNSSMTSARYMDTVWQKLKDTGLNTVLGCVTWEDIEPREGEFDFSELEAVILGAKAHDLRLVLLWFGSFKNGILYPFYSNLNTTDDLQDFLLMPLHGLRKIRLDSHAQCYERLAAKLRSVTSCQYSILKPKLRIEKPSPP